MILDDVDHADVLNPILREKGIKSLLGVPLLVRGRAIGVLHVGMLTPAQFTATTSSCSSSSPNASRSRSSGRGSTRRRRLDQLKLNFVAIASHELRTPATAVYGVLTTLARAAASMPRSCGSS